MCENIYNAIAVMQVISFFFFVSSFFFFQREQPSKAAARAANASMNEIRKSRARSLSTVNRMCFYHMRILFLGGGEFNYIYINYIYNYYRIYIQQFVYPS